MTKMGRLTLGMTLLLMLSTAMTACGSGTNEPGEAVPTKTEQTQQRAQGELEEKATRIVQDEFGEVTIPVHPQRIAGIYLEDYLLALGVKPIVQWYHPYWGTQEYLKLDAPLFDISGSLEALLQQAPDLILVDGAVDKEKYELYSKIAPTYRLKEEALSSTRNTITTIADVLGIPEKAEQVLSSYEHKVNEGRQKLQQAVGDETVAVVRINIDDKSLALFGVHNSYTGVIYSEFGLKPVPMVADMTDYQMMLSEEAIPDLNADHLILFPSNGDWSTADNQQVFEVLDNPLWRSVPAVQKGNVYRFERSHWQSGQITANSMKLDDLLQAMVK